MDEGVTGVNIVKAVESIYKPTLELDLFKNIISAFYLQGTSSEVTEKVIITIYHELPSHETTLGEITIYLDQLYEGKEKPTKGIDNLELLITQKYDKKTALNVVRELNKNILPYDTNLIYKLNVATDKYVVMNYRENEVQFQIIKNTKGGNLIADTTRVLLCYPSEIIIHDNPISEDGRTFTISWITSNNGHFKTSQMSIPEIENYLIDHGYVLNRKYFKDIVTALIQIAIENELAIWKNEVETPGFYWNPETKNIQIIDYELKKVTKTELNACLDVIEDLANFFENHTDKLATTLKHGLIAPFGFCKKQMGQPLELLIPYMFHFGKGGSGKTTLSRIALYFYGEPNTDENDIGGTEFDTLARMGKQISKWTYLLVVNEPETLFDCKKCVSALKTMMERTNARGRYEGKTFKNILGLATLALTSNDPLPDIEGLHRRFVQLLYTHSEKKTDAEKREFMDHFHMKSPEFCSFNKLKHLANFTVGEILAEPELLELDWQSLSNGLILRAYGDVGRTVPDWLLEFAESVTLDDIDDEETEELRMFFIEAINRKLGQVKVYSSEDGYPVQPVFEDYVKTSSDFRDRVYNVLNERLIPYMVLHHARNGRDYVCFTSGLKKALHEANQQCYNVKGVAELLGWDYKPVKLPKLTKCMVVSFDRFVEFLYPSGDDLEVE